MNMNWELKLLLSARRTDKDTKLEIAGFIIFFLFLLR